MQRNASLTSERGSVWNRELLNSLILKTTEGYVMFLRGRRELDKLLYEFQLRNLSFLLSAVLYTCYCRAHVCLRSRTSTFISPSRNIRFCKRTSRTEKA